MRVLLMPSSYVPVLGGLQRATHDLAKGLAARGHSVRVVTDRHPRALPAREIIDGVPVERRHFLSPQAILSGGLRPDLALASFAIYPATMMRLIRLFREFQPDVVNVHFPMRQIPFVLPLRRLFRFRMVVSLHGAEIEESSGPRRQLRAVLREADAVTACSRYLLERAAGLIPDAASKAFPVHNGVDASFFEPAEPYPHPRRYLLAFARLTFKKGIDLLLEAFARSLARSSEADLVIAGDGEERERLSALSRALGIEARVRFLGQTNDRDIRRLLSGCLFAVVPSRQEPFGLSALEAMAAGKFVLATRVGGLGEFVPPATNLLVEPDAAALAAGMSTCLERIDEIQRLGRANRDAANRFSLDKMVEGYLAAYSARSTSRLPCT
jgi:glycosyltransferase involved in cell wall biosynthesis